jgi:thiamine kinase-like enzyme
LRFAPSPQASSFAAQTLSLRLEDGRALEVFFKDLDPAHQLFHARQVRNGDLERSRRELAMYRHVLSGRAFGTPELYAYRWEPSEGRFWLFIENVAGKKLSKLPELEAWQEAAAWAASFHVRSRTLPPRACEFLPVLDRDHHVRCADRIESKLPALTADARRLISRALDIYRQSIESLLGLPRSVIHNEFFGKNIMLRFEGEPRIATVDWETASVGPSYFDLVSLSSGRWPFQVRETMWRAYFERYQLEAEIRLDWERFRSDLGILAVYQALRWLGWWPDREIFPQFSRWTDELERVMRHFHPDLIPERVEPPAPHGGLRASESV